MHAYNIKKHSNGFVAALCTTRLCHWKYCRDVGIKEICSRKMEFLLKMLIRHPPFFVPFVHYFLGIVYSHLDFVVIVSRQL